ncbi:unnamed protein product [Caenorhabditis auriculariae]|uniref:Peptidase S1 domain-containing protein n=1 Tax=Caenorhabditis auriculariae TaxID=2777116 RepID=A0A8S1HY84_9PELO|nr:unnamed protein product [Caenorhabditis auriculariae]
MPQIIRIKMNDKELNFVPCQNILAKSSLTSAFLLPEEAIVSLSYELTREEIHCEMNEKGTAFILPEDYSNLKFKVESDRAPSRSSIPADFEGPTFRKRRRIYMDSEPLPVDRDIISRIGKYSWFYTKEDNLKRSAIPVTRYLAITYRHGENKHFVNGDCIRLSSYKNQKVIVDSYVVLVDDSLDLIVLQSKSAELCNRDLILEAAEPERGMPYILMGYSVVHGRTSHISFSAGIISSDITSRLRFLGSSGSFKGDSGGSCWSDDGRLIGMQIEIEKIPHATDKNGRPASPASGGRCGIIPITKIHPLILKFLPPEEEIDWNE